MYVYNMVEKNELKTVTEFNIKNKEDFAKIIQGFQKIIFDLYSEKNIDGKMEFKVKVFIYNITDSEI